MIARSWDTARYSQELRTLINSSGLFVPSILVNGYVLRIAIHCRHVRQVGTQNCLTVKNFTAIPSESLYQVSACSLDDDVSQTHQFFSLLQNNATLAPAALDFKGNITAAVAASGAVGLFETTTTFLGGNEVVSCKKNQCF